MALNPQEAELYARAQAGDQSAIEALQRMVFEEPPVSVREFVLSPDYLNQGGFVFRTIVDMIEHVMQPGVREGFLELGKGSGKSTDGALFLCYNAYWLHNLRRPQIFYQLRPRTTISLLNVSISAEQASSVIFDDLVGLIENSKYFRGKFSVRKKDISFPQKRIRAISGHSGSTVWRGYHTFAAVLDEINFFKDKKGRSNADEMYDVLIGSLKTRFPDAYKLLAVSSTRADGDFLSRRMKPIKELGTPVIIPPASGELVVSNGQEVAARYDKPESPSNHE